MLLTSLLLFASAPTTVDSPVAPEQHIYDGTETDGCQFPTTLMMGGCTATLVSPHVVITAMKRR